MDRIKSNQKTAERLLQELQDGSLDASPPDLPPFLVLGKDESEKEKKTKSRKCEFWIRFLFSALVDADRLDTERFYDSQRNQMRGNYSSIEELRKELERFLDNKLAHLGAGTRDTLVNKARSEVLASCRQAAENDPGIFALTVPTGGGKTLSAMSFALAHAERHGLRRVVVVIPYTSIIEQNAKEYRLALGAENVVEHHSNLDIEEYRKRHGEEETQRMELASENWEAPVIVTTTVQFFESLFSNRTSQCRKLHNISRSVVILDEVQTLPPDYLMCILDALNGLKEHYGCSILLSTATPPALVQRDRFECGLNKVQEIVGDPDALAQQLNRVEYSWPSPESPPISWGELSGELTRYEQVLVVVHRRNDARELAERLQESLEEDTVFHLSALMCPAHRTEVLARVKERTQNGLPCRLVSTQLVEAGVDLDFPVVYRALGGLDSMVQAAGRCNREGRLNCGRVVIFRAPSKPPSGTPSKAMEIAEGFLRKYRGNLDVLTPGIFSEYFRSLYFGSELDAKMIQTLRQEFKFADVARDFRLIEDGFTRPIVVPYKKAHARLEELRDKGPSREILRSLQPFIINIYPNAFNRLYSSGALEEVAESLFALNRLFNGLYDPDFGLTVGDETIAPNPDDLVV